MSSASEARHESEEGEGSSNKNNQMPIVWQAIKQGALVQPCRAMCAARARQGMNEALRGLIAKWRSLGKQNKEAPFAFTIFNRFADELEAALASQPEQAPFPLSDIEIEKVIAKIRPVVDSEFINRIHPNAQTQTNLVLTALKQVLEERVAAPAPAEEAG